MEFTTQKIREAFDFSQDAQAFKNRLWNRLKKEMAAPSVQELEDDDLAWVNAAGVPYSQSEQKDIKD